MLYSGKSYSNGWLGLPPISGNLHMTINMDHNGSFFWGMMINHRSWVNKGVICLWTSLFRRFFGILCYIISTVYLMWFHNPTIQVHNLWYMSYPIFALADWCIPMHGQTWSIMKYEATRTSKETLNDSLRFIWHLINFETKFLTASHRPKCQGQSPFRTVQHLARSSPSPWKVVQKMWRPGLHWSHCSHCSKGLICLSCFIWLVCFFVSLIFGCHWIPFQNRCM